MLILFVFFRCLRRALWLIPASFVVVNADLILLPFVRSALDFFAGKNPPNPLWFRALFVTVSYFFGVVWYTGKYSFLLSQTAFDSRVQKTPHWQNHLMPKIQKEIEAGELVFPSFAESRSMTPQEYITRMFVAKTHWNDPELRKRQPKLRDSIFKI